MANQVVIEYRAELGKIKAQLKELEKNLEGVNSEAEKGDDNIKKMNDGGNNLLKTFKNLAAAAGLAFGAREIINYTREAVTLAGKLEGVEAAFRRIGDERLLQGLRNATQGTVSDLQLMQQAVRASNFEIPLQQLGSLFEFARRRAKETGEEVDYLVESIILGIGRKSPLILDNLGISAVKLRQELSGVSAEAATVGEVAAVVGKIASDALAQMGEETETAADKQQRLRAQLQNMQIQIGEGLIPTFNRYAEVLIDVLGFIDQFYLGDNINQANNEAKAVTQTLDAIDRYIERGKTAGKEMEEMNRTRQALIGLLGEESRETIEAMTDREIAYRQELALLEEKQRQLTDNGKVIANEGTAERTLYEQNEARLRAIVDVLKQYDEQRRKLNEAIASEPNTLTMYEEKIKALTQQWKETEVNTKKFYDLQQQIADLKAEYERLTMSEEDRIKLAKEREEIMRKLNQAMIDSLRTERDYQIELDDTKRLLEQVLALEDSMYQAREEMRKKNEQSRQDDFEKFEEQSGAELELLQRILDEGRQMYISLGMTEAEYTEYSMQLAEKRAKFLLEQGALTRDEYEKIIQGLKTSTEATATEVFDTMLLLNDTFSQMVLATSKRFQDERIKMSQAELLAMVRAGELTNMEYEKIVESQEKLARFNKAMAFFEIAFNTAKALSNVIASNSSTGPLAPLTIAKGIAVVLAGMAQVTAVLSQSSIPTAPRFEKGGWIGGRSHADGGTLIEAERGEFIINRRDAAANKDILKAINTGNLSKYVVRHYVEPLARSMAADKNSLADNIAASLAEQMGMHGNYLRKLTKGVRITNPQEIARSMKQPKVNRFNN